MYFGCYLHFLTTWPHPESLEKGKSPRNTALWGLVANRNEEGSGSLAVPDGKLC